jgi:hypothetical protein
MDDKKASKASVVAAHGALVITMDPNEMKSAMEKCVRETGKVKFGIREISVTKLGDMSDAAVTVN